MYSDFIQIKSLAGELKISHKRQNFGITISTEECVMQKPHVSYYFLLKDIISIYPYEKSAELRGHYRVHVRQLIVHNRSGIFTLHATELIVPIIPKLLEVISQTSGMFKLDLGDNMS